MKDWPVNYYNDYSLENEAKRKGAVDLVSKQGRPRGDQWGRVAGP